MESSGELQKTSDEWIDWFANNIAPADLDRAGIRAYLHHLADLGVFEVSGKENWILTGMDTVASCDSFRDALWERLDSLSRTEAGFALPALLGRKMELTPAPSTTTGRPGFAKAPGPERSSDLSNLQIVKKVGRQLQSFLELEQSLLNRLQGTHTANEEAKKIFNYLLSKSREKSPPRQWEQLSRKRHR